MTTHHQVQAKVESGPAPGFLNGVFEAGSMENVRLRSKHDQLVGNECRRSRRWSHRDWNWESQLLVNFQKHSHQILLVVCQQRCPLIVDYLCQQLFSNDMVTSYSVQRGTGIDDVVKTNAWQQLLVLVIMASRLTGKMCLNVTGWLA